MAVQVRGLSVPVTVGKNGGAKLNSKAAHFNQTLMLAFSEGGDKNSFQDLGIDSRVIFSIADDGGIARIKRRIEQIALKFSESISLDPDRPVTFEKTGNAQEGEVEMVVRYIDLATNEVGEFTNSFGNPEPSAA